MRTRFVVTLLGVALALFAEAAPALAHHAFSAEFDASKPIKLQGTVQKMEWVNPHSWLTLEVKKPDGTIEMWAIEAGAPNSMFRRGFNKNSLPIGTEVVVDGFLSKDGKKKANGRDITFPDGRRLFMGSSGTGTPGVPAEQK